MIDQNEVFKNICNSFSKIIDQSQKKGKISQKAYRESKRNQGSMCGVKRMRRAFLLRSLLTLSIYGEVIEVDIYNTLEGALFESTGNTILWALCSMLEAGRSKKGGNGLK